MTLGLADTLTMVLRKCFYICYAYDTKMKSKRLFSCCQSKGHRVCKINYLGSSNLWD